MQFVSDEEEKRRKKAEKKRKKEEKKRLAQGGPDGGDAGVALPPSDPAAGSILQVEDGADGADALLGPSTEPRNLTGELHAGRG